MSALNLLVPPSSVVSAASATRAAPAPETRDDKNPATFSRLLARSRAAAETAPQPPAPSARQAAAATPNATPNASAHSATKPNPAARAERRGHDDADDRAGDAPDAASPRSAANDAPQRSAEGDARAEPSDAAGSTPDDLHAGATLPSPLDLTSPVVAGVLPAAAALPAPAGDVAALDAAAAPVIHAAGALAALGKAWPGHAGSDASATPTAAVPGADATASLVTTATTTPAPAGRALGAAAAPGDTQSAINAPAVPNVLPNAALAQLAALSAAGGKGDEAPKTPAVLEGVLPGVGAALAGQGVAPASRGIDNPASATASVATAVGDPGFHEALAARVSVFARGGLSKAELQLNPVELGPVSVSIAMNGDQARVDFGADRAQTRKAIEAGWAELAASLHDAGFTLSGGGVSEQAGRQAFERPATPHNARTDRAGADDEAAVTSIVVARPRAGSALDTYA